MFIFRQTLLYLQFIFGKFFTDLNKQSKRWKDVLDQKHQGSFEMWCWRWMKISWTDHVRNEEVLLTVKEQRNILQK
jgi:hypothetical protein